jgi:hypothetical protein
MPSICPSGSGGTERMSATVPRLPTAATTYIRVRCFARQWCVDIVTPVGGGKPFATTVASSPSRTAAIDYGRHVGAQMQRPVRLPGLLDGGQS